MTATLRARFERTIRASTALPGSLYCIVERLVQLYEATGKKEAAAKWRIDMPLFLEDEIYINVPLEATYRAAYRGVPRRWQRVLDAQSP